MPIQLSPVLADHVKIHEGQEVVSLAVMAVFWGVSAEEAENQFHEQMAEHGQFRMLKSWMRNSKELQAKHGTKDAAELFRRIVLDGGDE